MVYTTEKLLQNEIVNFAHLILMANLFPITSIKLFLFFFTPLVAFSSSLKHAKCIAFMHNLFFVLFWMC